MDKFFQKKYKIFLLVLLPFLLSPVSLFAVSRTNPFTIGQTIDPGAESVEPCGPTDTNCFVSMLGALDEGSSLTSNVLNFDFVGSGVTATNLNGLVTVTIPGSTGGATSLATPTGSNANGGSISSSVLTLSLADGTNPGIVSTTTQTFAGDKTISGALTVLGGISNISNTGFNPSVSGSVTTNSNPYTLYVSGNYAYVANYGSSTLQVIDISNPASPSVIGSVSTDTNPRSVYVSGRYAYVTNFTSNTLQVIDISNPASPSVTGSVATGNAPISIYIAGHYAYVANLNSSTLQVIDISNPASPSVTGSVATGTSPVSVYVSGRYAYVTNNSSDTLQVIDISNPASPSVTGSVATDVEPFSVYVSGRYAYVANLNSSTLQVIDISNPASPSVTGSVATGNVPRSVYVSGRYAYVTNYSDDTIQVIDVSTPSTPVAVGSVTTGSGPFSLSVSGKYIYVVNGSAASMQVISISGAEFASAIIHSLDVGNIKVRNDISAQGNVSAGNSLFVGNGGIFSNGGLALVNASATSYIAGDLSIGTSTNANKLYVLDSQTADYVALFENTANSSSPGGVQIKAGTDDGTGTSSMISFNRPDGTQIGSVSQNAATTVAFNTTSDERLKEDTGQEAKGLADLLILKVHNFSWNDGGFVQDGFFAQELYKIFPEAVSIGSDEKDSKGRLVKPWAIDYGKVTPLLAKSIQDLNYKVDSGFLKMTQEDINKFAALGAVENYIDAIRSEVPRNVVSYVEGKLRDGFKPVSDFFASRITAIKGYFVEVYTNRSHQKELCVGDVQTEGETCVTKQQLDNLLNGNNIQVQYVPTPIPNTDVNINPTSDEVDNTDPISEDENQVDDDSALNEDSNDTPDIVESKDTPEEKENTDQQVVEEETVVQDAGSLQDETISDNTTTPEQDESL